MPKYYLYKATIWNENIGEENKVCGLVAASSYTQALEYIIADYEEENIVSIDSIMEIESICKTLTLNNAMYHMFFEGHNERKIKSYHLDERDYKGKSYYDFPEEE